MTTTPRHLLGIATGSLVLGLISVAFTHVSAQRRPATTVPSSVTIRLPMQSADNGFAGEDSCRSCHRSELTEFHKTGHARVTSADAAQRMNCEAVTVRAKPTPTRRKPPMETMQPAPRQSGDFAFKGTPAENSARCLTCHASTPKPAAIRSFAARRNRRVLPVVPQRSSCRSGRSIGARAASDHAGAVLPGAATCGRTALAPRKSAEGLAACSLLLVPPAGARTVRPAFSSPRARRIDEMQRLS